MVKILCCRTALARATPDHCRCHSHVQLALCARTVRSVTGAPGALGHTAGLDSCAQEWVAWLGWAGDLGLSGCVCWAGWLASGFGASTAAGAGFGCIGWGFGLF